MLLPQASALPRLLFYDGLSMAAQDGKAIREEMFTYMASVIIAVNPLNGKLKDPPIERFIGPHERSPHPFDLAETAFQQMSSKVGEGFTNQSIVISGESGAGKSETTKLILQFIADLSSRQSGTYTGGGGSTQLEQQILQANPVMEAFGNAKTLRNCAGMDLFTKPNRQIQGSTMCLTSS